MTYRYHDNFNDRHDQTEIGSRNRIWMRDVDLSAFAPAVSIAVVFFVILLTAALGYLIMAQAVLFTSLILAVVVIGFCTFVWHVVMGCIRSLAQTRAVCSYYHAQHERNRLISPAGSQYAIFDDDGGRYRLEHGRDVKYEYTLEGSAPGTTVEADNAPDKLETMLRARNGKR